jgi:hypothetical protein
MIDILCGQKTSKAGGKDGHPGEIKVLLKADIDTTMSGNQAGGTRMNTVRAEQEMQRMNSTGVKYAIKDWVIKDNKTKQERDYYREVEKLLYSLPALEEKLVQEEEALRNGLIEMPKRSKSVVRYFSNLQLLTCDPEEYIESLKRSLHLTRMEVDRIHMALDSIRSWPYYPIIEYKYFMHMTHDEIGNILFMDASSVSRHKNRMIKQLCTVLFGQVVD